MGYTIDIECFDPGSNPYRDYVETTYETKEEAQRAIRQMCRDEIDTLNDQESGFTWGVDKSGKYDFVVLYNMKELITGYTINKV